MNDKRGKNTPASIRDRLLALARERGEDFQLLLTQYGLERVLYRLSQLPYRDRFILKGAMLFMVWGDQPHRPTRDVDFLAFGDNSEAGLQKIFREFSDGHLGNHFFYQMRCRFGHSPGAAGGARSFALAAKGDQGLVLTFFTLAPNTPCPGTPHRRKASNSQLTNSGREWRVSISTCDERSRNFPEQCDIAPSFPDHAIFFYTINSMACRIFPAYQLVFQRADRRREPPPFFKHGSMCLKNEAKRKSHFRFVS